MPEIIQYGIPYCLPIYPFNLYGENIEKRDVLIKVMTGSVLIKYHNTINFIRAQPFVYKQIRNWTILKKKMEKRLKLAYSYVR